MKPLDQFYAQNDILARSITRKLYRYLKSTAIRILQDEMKQVSPKSKVVIKRCIEMLEYKL